MVAVILTSCTPSIPTTESGPTPTAVIAGSHRRPASQTRKQNRKSNPRSRRFALSFPPRAQNPFRDGVRRFTRSRGLSPPYDHFYFARPIAADNVNWPLAEYRYGGVFFAPNIVHTGVDIDAEEGTPILAAGSGTVVSADWGLFSEIPGNVTDPYGMAVVLRHDFGYKGQTLYTVYAHMSEIIAVVGQHVETGDVLGLVGDTGVTTGPHLHFEVRMGDNTFFKTYNPELWMLRRRAGEFWSDD